MCPVNLVSLSNASPSSDLQCPSYICDEVNDIIRESLSSAKSSALWVWGSVPRKIVETSLILCLNYAWAKRCDATKVRLPATGEEAKTPLAQSVVVESDVFCVPVPPFLDDHLLLRRGLGLFDATFFGYNVRR